MSPRPVRRVHYPAGAQFPTHDDFQANYINLRTARLIPNTELWIGDERWITINSLGCKGGELDPALGTIGFFGDSVTYGGGPCARQADAWPFHVAIPGYQALNAGVEGYSFPRIIRRYEELSAAVRFDAVVVGGTWANLVYNVAGDRLVYDTIGEREWRAYLDAFRGAPRLSLCTLPTALIPESSDRGLDELIQRPRAAGVEPFYPWGTWPTTPEKTRIAFEGVLRYNNFVRSYCAETGAILIDLFYVYRPASYDELPVMFQDPVHPRWPLYPDYGACAREALTPHLAVRSADECSAQASACATDDRSAQASACASAPQQPQHVYPLW